MAVSRRSLLGAILLASAGPVIVRASSLMRVKPTLGLPQLTPITMLGPYDPWVEDALSHFHLYIDRRMREHFGFVPATLADMEKAVARSLEHVTQQALVPAAQL